MCPTDQINVIALAELRDNIFTKREAYSTVVLAPFIYFFVGVTPEKVAQESCVWDIGWPHNILDGVNFDQLWAETTMHAQNLIIDKSSDRQAVEAVGEDLPQLYGVSPLTFIVEAIYPVNRGAFVIAPEEEKVLRVFYLVGEEKADRLEGHLPTVNVVSQEEVVRVGREATILEEA